MTPNRPLTPLQALAQVIGFGIMLVGLIAFFIVLEASGI